MSASFQLPKPEQLVDLVGTVAAVQLAMNGAFDDRIAALKVATADLEEQTSIAQTLKAAQKIKDDADSYAEQVKGAADALATTARALADKASSREATVSARETAVAGRESAAEARQKTQDTREQAILDAQNSRDSALTAREQAVKNGEANLAGGLKQLAADQAAFNQRLEALKV